MENNDSRARRGEGNDVPQGSPTANSPWVILASPWGVSFRCYKLHSCHPLDVRIENEPIRLEDSAAEMLAQGAGEPLPALRDWGQ